MKGEAGARGGGGGGGGETSSLGAARFVVHGRVQGVGFRWFVLREGHQLGMRGFVRNLRDGSVEVVAWGSPEGLRELERVLTRGPAAARVERVDKSDVPHEVSIPNDFHIR